MTEGGLVVSGLRVAYGKALAVDGIELVARPGEVTALIGANGAGKSSTLLGIYGSVPAKGSVRIAGTEVGSRRALQRARAGVALVPQGRQLFPKMTVVENLRIMAELLKLPGRSVDEAMARFPILGERRGQMAGVLSGGEQQMLVVARALMTRPDVILLDETMTGLAPKIVAEIMQTARQLAEQGSAVLVADPTLSVTRAIVDRGYVIVRGRLAAEEQNPVDLDRAYQRAMGVLVQEVDEETEAVTGP